MSLTRIRAGFAATVAAAAVLALAGCSGGASSPAASSPGETGADGFPVTIEHAFGETVIESKPERIVTWGWGAADAVLALGEVPVAIPAQAYGGDEDGVLPWIADELESLDAQTPIVLDSSTNEVPIEAVAAADPDLFLAPYSGLTEDEYQQLTGLGIPVVAYPETAWSTPWRDVITITGQALGAEAAADEVIAGIEEDIAAKAAENPAFAENTVAQVWDTAGTFYVYLPADPRVEFIEDLGFTTAPSVSELDTGEATFYYTLGYENLDRLTSDVLIAYADSQEQMDAFLASDQAALLPQVAAGKVVQIVGEAEVASMSPPTALSVAWGLDAYVDALAQVVGD